MALASDLITMAGYLAILVGTLLLSGAIFRNRVAQKYYGKGFGDNFPWRFKFFAFLLGINSENWTKIWRADLLEKEVKKYQDPDGPIRGFFWILVGTILEIIGGFMG